MHYIKKIINKIPNKILLILILATLLLISPLIIDNKIATNSDYEFHITNLILNQGYINPIKLDLFIPKIFSGNIANGFGYGTGIFYPPLSYYLTCYISYFLNLINQNSILSPIYLQTIVILISSIIMYKFIKRVSKDKCIAIIGSLSYISSTYFLCDIYIRFALAESLTFVFIPLVFWGLYELFYGDEKKFNILFIIGYLGMIHSHLVLAVYLTIIIFILLILNFKKILKRDKIKKLFISSLIILLISSPYLVPLLEHKIFGTYSVFEPNFMYTSESIKEQAINLNKLITIQNYGVKTNFNHIILIITILTTLLNKKIFQKEEKRIFKIALVVTILSIFISTKYFPWNIMPEILKTIQFPWRLLGLASFGMSMITGYIIKITNEKYKKIFTLIISIFIVLTGYFGIITSKDTIFSKEQILKPTIPNHMSMGVQMEYLPRKTITNIVYYYNRNQDIAITSGEATTKILDNKNLNLKSQIELTTNKATIELPRLYYLGYVIKLTDENNNTDIIKYYENKNGFIELEVNKSGILKVSYEGTLANKISNYVSIITIIICILIIINKKILHKIKKAKNTNKKF